MPAAEHQIKVVFVCMGNICRSPTAHGVFQALVDEQNMNHVIGVDSAGTHSYHIENPPDLRSQAVAQEKGVNLAKLRGRKLMPQDLIDFNYVIGMDKSKGRSIFRKNQWIDHLSWSSFSSGFLLLQNRLFFFRCPLFSRKPNEINPTPANKYIKYSNS